MINIFLILGMSGAGKTTVAQLLEQNNNNLEHYSIGDKFREYAKEDRELAKYVFNGKRVPLDIAKKVILSILNSLKKDIIILDGYPRDIEQMLFFNSILNENENLNLVHIFEINIDKEIAKNRVVNRYRGKDDNTIVFNERLEDYTVQMKKIRKFYDSSLINIDGHESPLKISQKIEKIITQTQQGNK